MLVPASVYFCTYATCKLRHLSFCGTSFCKTSSQKDALKPLSQSCTMPFVFGHSSDSGRPKVPLVGKTSDNHLVQVRVCMDDGKKFPTCSVRAHTSFFFTHVSPAFFEQPIPFPHISFILYSLKKQV